MKASEVMTKDVVTVRPDTPVPQIARLLLAKRISAVPVVDDLALPIGMVSEGDLIGRDEPSRESRRDWWLAMLAEGEDLDPKFVAIVRDAGAVAGQIMSRPIITVGPDTEVSKIARLLGEYRIKRVPVVHDGHLMGIVSRADLLRDFVGAPVTTSPNQSLLGRAIANLDEHFHHGHDNGRISSPISAPPPSIDTEFRVADFQKLAAEFDRRTAEQRDEARRALTQKRQHRVEQLIEDHISDETWRELLHKAHLAAEHGEKDFLLLRFPSQLCSDGGRAINVPDANWPATLRGDPAEIYLRWEKELKSRGFQLAAQVIDFPDGMLGDIGLYLIWG